MADFIVWPRRLLVPLQCTAVHVPFTRSGGNTLAGLSRPVRTDRGFWRVSYRSIALRHAEKRRTWNAIRSTLSGMSGLVAVSVFSFDSAPWPDGAPMKPLSVPHDDGATFNDGSEYETPNIVIEAVNGAAIGDTSITLRIINGAADLSGVRFSYQHALYETGPATSVSGSFWALPIFPAVRAPIPAGATLEFDRPTCMCRLSSDAEMAAPSMFGKARIDVVDVSFVEAVDYWNDLAAAA